MKRHEKELEQYFEDWKNHDEPWELWEIKTFCRAFGEAGYWTTWKTMESLDVVYFSNKDCEFRRKPETIFPRGIDLPKPITVEPKEGDRVWAFTPEIAGGYLEIYYNPYGDGIHTNLFNNGCLHKTKEAAQKYVEWWKSEVINKCK